jgi:TonB family protein
MTSAGLRIAILFLVSVGWPQFVSERLSALVASTAVGDPLIERSSSGCDFVAYKPITVSDYLTPANTISTKEPSYPPLAVKSHVEGEVQVKVLINNKGRIIRACSISGHPLLRVAAASAAKGWRFKPWCSGCTKKVYIQGILSIVFSLKQSSGNFAGATPTCAITQQSPQFVSTTYIAIRFASLTYHYAQCPGRAVVS